MNSTETIYSSFSSDWIVKSIPYSISYKKAYTVSEIDEIFCSIINAKGGSIDKIEFGELLGFNLSDIPNKGLYKDIAEESIFNDYLNQVFEYNLIKEDEGFLKITDLGKDSLISKLKYKLFYSNVTLFENVTAKKELHTFSFKEVFDLKSEINIESSSINKKIIEGSNLKNKLQYQLFEDDIFKGELLEIFESSSNVNYLNFELTCQLIPHNNKFDIKLFLNGVEKTALNYLVTGIQNISLKEELKHKGKFYHILNSDISIDVNIIAEFNDLWNWKELAENKNIDWSQTDIFNLFKNNGDGSIWKSVSENVPTDIIKIVIDAYVDYWDWRALTQRFENDFIIKSIDKFTWDFEELSTKENDFVIQLLAQENFKNKNWDWQYLSQVLPDKFIIENINTFPWDFYLLTTTKFEVFKTVFNADIERQLKNSWDWKYISEEININYLYQNISKFSVRVIWDIVLNRFFNDENILNKCISGKTFKQTLNSALPENFNISHQEYLWSIEVISFFDNLNLINWETTSYIKGFDTNTSVHWSEDVFNSFASKVTSEKGIANISSLITDKSLLFNDFKWDWIALSKNKSIVSESNFLSKVITQPSSLIDKFVWSEIYPIHEITYWNENLLTFEKNTDSDLNRLFWNQISRDEDIGFILSNFHFPWDWTYITETCSVDLIIESKEDENLISKWNWQIATRKFDKKSILEYLEEFAQYWDWEYIINDVFSIEIDLSLENGSLTRVAACISTLETEKKVGIWKLLTSLFSIETLKNFIDTTSSIDVFEWDWNTISGQKHLPTDLLSLNNLQDKLNWSILSENESIQRKFSYNNWGKDRKGCYDNIVKYLQQFKGNWDWKILSINKDLNWDRRLLSVFKKQDWDWAYLSEFGRFLIKSKRDKDDYLIKLLSQFPAIDFSLFSKRQDITISSEVILLKQKENWDWCILSSNQEAKITSELLIKLSSKNWDWESISLRKEIDINNVTILKLIDKGWNWNYLSSHPNLIFDFDFISQVKLKPWDWQIISRHSSFSPSIEILNQTKSFNLDWTHLSKRTNLNLTREFLAKFENNWDWNNITRQSNIDFKDTDLVVRFIDRWDWSFLCQEVELTLNKETLTLFKNHLDWDIISSNTNINFTKGLIQENKSFWNWNKLKHNNRILESLGDFVQETINHSPILSFLDKIESQHSRWGGSIYHFSHIENAVEIIKNRKIQSRNNANILGDAAGNVVHLRNDAHNYARFYLRPHTPTQFYNEFLGKNTNDGYKNNKTDTWVSWYERARSLGFPKCPIPIFFRFSIKEVLFKSNNNTCCISDGNMQTSSTSFGSLDTMIDKFGFEDLFYTPEQYATKEDYNRYRDYSQQEFLVQNELTFDDFIDFEIVCQSEEDRKLLISLIGVENKDLFSKIKTKSSYYNNKNPRVKVEFNDSKLHIKSGFNGDGYLSLYPNCHIDSTNIESGDVEKVNSEKLIFKSYLILNNYYDGFKLTFTDESKREWFIHKSDKIVAKPYDYVLSYFDIENNSLSEPGRYPKSIDELCEMHPKYLEVYDSKVRHYKLKEHTNIVLNQFDLYFSNYFDDDEKCFFRFFLILHDIGKPTAFKKGDKSNQHKYSIDIVNDIWNTASYSNDDLVKIKILLDGDPIGEYFKGQKDLNNLVSLISKSSLNSQTTPQHLLKTFLIYYQCDVASYTADAGGFKFLEHLFEYNNGEKIFDEEEGLIRFSPKYWAMYLELKKEIYLCQ